MRRRALLGLMSAAAALAALLPGRPALAAREASKDTAFLVGMLRSHALPRFEAFAAATAEYAGRLDRFAASPSAAGLEEARAGHRAVTDSWAGVQHLRPGPLTAELRFDRISFWPERPGVVQRQIGQILRDRNATLLEPGALAGQSAAVQGLTVLERLLFDEGVTADSFTGDEPKRFRGALAVAATRNLAAMTAGARDEWAALEGPLAAGEPTILGPTPAEAVNTLFVAAATALQIVADQKLMAPLGDGPAEPKPLVVEALRSGRALRNIAVNLDAVRGLLLGERNGPGVVALLPDTAGGAAARKAVGESLAAAIGAVEAVPGPLNVAVADPARRGTVEAALRAVRAARAELLNTMAPLLQMEVGFNELDGD